MKRPAFQFYPADWRKDAALQSCSLSAQGLWVNMMCIAHECDPYGYLSVNGKPMQPAQLARLVGLSAKECLALLEELGGAGVYSKSEDGAFFSRRMVKDERLRSIRAEAGRLGGNPNLLGDKVKQKDNQTSKQSSTPSSSSSSSPTGENPLSGKPDGVAVDKGQKTKVLNATAVRVLAHLNTTCGTKFEPVEANLKFIRGRLAEYPEETLIRVVDAKRKEWTGTEQAKYLRPETLFGATKCAQYAGQLDIKPSEKPAGRELLEIEAESIDGQIRFLCTSHGEHFVAAKNALTKFSAQLNGSARNIIVKPSSGQPSKFSVEELRTA